MLLLERFWKYVEVIPEHPCWEWIGYKNPKGYGKFWKDGVCCSTHRISWEIYCGVIPQGLHVLHKCDNPSCVNPEHLFLGTNKDNTLDKMSKGRHQSQRTDFCKRGHLLTGINKKGYRFCRTCTNYLRSKACRTAATFKAT